MPGPAGQSVGKVTVRVAPDTSDFRKELRAQLSTRSQNIDVEIPVNLDFSGLRTQLRALQAQLSRAGPVNVGVDTNSQVEVRVDRTVLAAEIELVRRRLQRIGPIRIPIHLEERGGAQIGSTVRSMRQLRQSSTQSIQAVRRLTRRFATMFSVAAAGGPIMVAALTAIQSAVGGIAAGITGLPALISTLGVPIATVALGVDRLKTGFETLTDEVDVLKTSVGDVFEDELLSNILPDISTLLGRLDDDFENVASSISGLGTSITDVFTSSQGINQVEDMFSGVATAIDRMSPAIRRFVQESLDIASSNRLYRILGDTISGVVNEFSSFMDEVQSSGLLAESLRSVRDLLTQVASLMGDWATAGMEFLNGAAPGIDEFLEGLQGFFNRFDWDRLGRAFGDVFGTLGRTLGNMPDSMIQVLENAMVEIAQATSRLIANGGLQLFMDFLVLLGGTSLGAIEIITKIAQGFLSLLEPIAEVLDTLGVMPNRVDEIRGTMDDFSSSLDRSGRAAQGMSEKLFEIRPSMNLVHREAKTMANNVLHEFRLLEGRGGLFIGELADKVVAGGQRARENFIAEFREMSPGIINSKGEITGSAEEVARDVAIIMRSTQGYYAGRNLVERFAAGMISMKDVVSYAAGSVIRAVNEWFPSSPAERGPFSGSGWTPYRGRALVEGFARGISDASGVAESATDQMIRGVDQSITGYTRKGGLSADVQAAVSADDFGGVGDRVSEALAGWEVRLDSDGIARLVNKSNQKNKRR